MKKLFIALMTCAAIVSCSKSDVVFDNEQSEIAFSPVAQNTTKSVAGYDDNGVFDGKFPTDIDLYVFANAVEGEYSADNDGDAYFQNAQFEWNTAKGTEDTQNDVATAGAYAGNPTRYWPNVKKLIFAGYSDACNVTTLDDPTMNFLDNELTIKGYTQSNYTATTTTDADGNTTTTYTYPEKGENDLMWFPYDNTAYDKSANEIAAAMKHACSWITIKVVGDGVTGDNWILNSLVIKGIEHNSASVVCGESTAIWTLPTTPSLTDEVVYSNGTTVIPAPATGTGVNPSSTAKKFENKDNNTIIIPQTPTTLDVTYTYTSDADNDLTLTETANVSLDYDGAGTAWQSGYHYIYTITITATEILIDPYVVDWTAYTGNEIAKDVQ